MGKEEMMKVLINGVKCCKETMENKNKEQGI